VTVAKVGRDKKEKDNAEAVGKMGTGVTTKKEGAEQK
jgi:hypothetical protein